MKWPKEFVATRILLCVLELIVGILLWIDPAGFATGIFVVGGVLLMLLGVVQIVQYFRLSPEEAFFRQPLVKGLLLIGIGALLLEGIGDTIRVSLSADPVEEVYAAKRILRALGLEKEYVDVVACPTCGRCAWDCMSLAEKVEKRTFFAKKKCRIAVMGCVVNGPGEAKDADLGIAGGKDECIIFRRGEIGEKIPKENAEEVFLKLVGELIGER